MKEPLKRIMQSMRRAGLIVMLVVIASQGASPAGAFTGMLTSMDGQSLEYPTEDIAEDIGTGVNI